MFYAALGRLVAALDDAAHTTLDIRAVMTQTELDVAAIFKERDTGGAGKGKGLASGAAPQPPWDTDGFGWWADQFKLQHGRAPTDADYAEFQLSWKLSSEGKVQWTDADWEAFYEARQLGLDKYLAQGIQFDGNWTGKQVLDAVKELNKQIIVLPSEIKPGYGGIQQPYFPPAMLVSQAYMWSKGALLDATATPTPNATPTPTSPSSKPTPTPTPNPNPNPKTKLFDDLNKTALGAAIFANQPKLWDKLDIRIQSEYPKNAVSFPKKDGKYQGLRIKDLRQGHKKEWRA